jgi:hypothetical protein
MKDIAGFERLYAITRDGRVWSYPKSNNRNKYGCYMKQQLVRNGYLAVQLRKDGMVFSTFVHRLVAEAFIPNPENKPQVNHKHEDGNKTRNVVDNLEWATNKENSDHSFISGICKKPLTEGEVVEIRKICRFHSCRSVAFAYNVHPAAIWDINRGNRYAEVRI